MARKLWEYLKIESSMNYTLFIFFISLHIFYSTKLQLCNVQTNDEAWLWIFLQEYAWTTATFFQDFFVVERKWSQNCWKESFSSKWRRFIGRINSSPGCKGIVRWVWLSSLLEIFEYGRLYEDARCHAPTTICKVELVMTWEFSISLQHLEQIPCNCPQTLFLLSSLLQEQS